MESSSTSAGLPVWIELARWFVLPGFAYAATVVCTRFFERWLAPRRKDVTPSWPDNARAVQQVVGAVGLGMLVPAGVLTYLLCDQLVPLGESMPRLLVALVVVVQMSAVARELRRIVARHGGKHIASREMRRARNLFALLHTWNRHAVLAFLLLPRADDPWPWWSFALGAALYLAFYCGLGVTIAGALGLVRAPRERLRASVARIAARAGMRMPGVRELDVGMLNGLALPVTGIVAATRGLLEALGDEELDAIMAHELGHLRERRSFIVRHLPMHALALGILFVRTAGWESCGFSVLGVLLFLFLAWCAIAPRFLRAAEVRADAFARAHADPSAFARALETLHRTELVPPEAAPAATHPGLAERTSTSGAPTAEPNAPVPARGRLRMSGLWLVPVVALAQAVRDATTGSGGEVRLPRLALALRGPEPASLAALALAEERAGRDESALRLTHGGAALEPANPWWPMEEARLLARLGRCDEAGARFAEAERLCLAAGEFDCESWLAQGREWLAGCP